MMEFFASTQFFYYASLVVNILFILISAYTLWRIESSNAESSKYIVNAAKMTQDALKSFLHWTSELNVNVNHQNLPAAPSQEQASKEQLKNALEAQKLLTELQKVAVSIEEMDTQRLQAMMGELDSVIEGMVMQGGEPGSRAQTELMRLKGQRERLAAEVEQLQVRLDESSKVIADLRRENRASFTAGSSLDLLKQVNERLFAELKTMRDRMLNAEERAAELSAELVIAQNERDKAPLGARTDAAEVEDKVAAAAPDAVVPFGSANNTAKLQKRVLELEADRAKLLDQVQEGQQALSRALREKAMIEERFLKLDEMAG
jgi:hypothetical protein